MKKYNFIFLLFFVYAMSANADIPSNYYTKMDGKKKEELKTATHEIINPHTVVTYNSLFPQQFPKTDVYPEFYNGRQRWWEMYSDNIYYVSNGWKGMNREHSLPKSWWGGDQNVAYTDLNHLYPSDADANGAKSNYPLGEVQSITYDNGVSKVGYAYQGQGGGASKVFEPADEYKGDFARTYFYMATCYQDYSWKYTYMMQNGTYPTLKSWAVELLLDWSRQDPVSQKEIDRNEAVYQIQGNRNPFIDFPELAEYIWGTRMNEVFYISEQGGTITPPITGDPELFAPVNGSSLDFGEVAVGSTQIVDLLVRGINLTSSLSIRVTGTNRNMFSLIGVDDNQIAASKINSDEGYKLSVKYAPTEEGNHTAAITLYDGGFPAGEIFNVSISGQSLPIPTLSKLKALSPTDVTDSSYTAHWEMPDEEVDYYIVNRTQYLREGAKTTRLRAEENYLVIDDRLSDIEEAYTVQSVRLGYESEPSNLIMVAPGDLVGIETYQPLSAAFIEGGLRIILEQQHTNLKIYDLTGKLIKRLDIVCGGEEIKLPFGVYFLDTDQSRVPVKVIVR